MGLFDSYRNLIGKGVASAGDLYGLPDLHVSEFLSGSKTQTNPAFRQPNPVAKASYGPVGQAYGQIGSLFGGTSSKAAQTPSGGGSGNNQGGQVLDVNNQVPQIPGGGGGGAVNTGPTLAAIEDSYNANSTYLNQIRGITETEATNARGALQGDYDVASSTLGQQKTKQLGSLDESGQTVQRNTANALGEARTTYNELGQKNQAYLSATGLGSSSVAEALQEKLGRDTFKAIENLTQNRDATLQNIEKQRGEVNQFYSTKEAELINGLNSAKQQITTQLQRSLAEVDRDRSLNEANRAAKKAEVIADARRVSSAASAEAAAQKQALDSWSTWKTGFLDASGAYAGGKLDLTAFGNYLDKMDEGLRASGVQIDRGSLIAGLYNPAVGAQGFAQSGGVVPYQQPSSKELYEEDLYSKLRNQ